MTFLGGIQQVTGTNVTPRRHVKGRVEDARSTAEGQKHGIRGIWGMRIHLETMHQCSRKSSYNLANCVFGWDAVSTEVGKHAHKNTHGVGQKSKGMAHVVFRACKHSFSEGRNEGKHHARNSQLHALEQEALCDVLVIACSRNTNVIIVWAWMLWLSHSLKDEHYSVVWAWMLWLSLSLKDE